jgi:phosphoribosyl 1,2-cyclic phosphate phosphodiesterase
MKIKFYGTSAGGGIPEIFCYCRVCENARKNGGKDVRTRSQAVIDDCLGIEFPVDTFAHTAYRGLDMRKVRNILITHAHHDHFLIQDVLSRPQGVDKVNFYMPKDSSGILKELLKEREEAYRSGRMKRTCDFTVAVYDLEHYQTYDVAGYLVTPLRARHHENLGSSLYIIRKDEKCILWGFDTGKFYEDVLDYIRRAKVRFDFVVLDCTLKENEQITTSHMDLSWCKEMADKLKGMGAVDEKTRIMVSHIGHLVEKTHDELCEATAHYGIEVAYDGLEIEL